MSSFQTLGIASIPAPLPVIARTPEVPREPVCAGLSCGQPFQKLQVPGQPERYDCVMVGGARFHDMRCMTAAQKTQYLQETKAATEKRERDLKANEDLVRAEKIEKATLALCLLQSESGPAQCEALGFPYAIALRNAEDMLTHLQGNGPFPKLQFAEPRITTNPRAGKTIRT
jgi:hypothetical protein